MFASMIVAAATAATCTATSPAHTAALVELYTSQGCSSCPPADRWLSQLQASDRVIPIALHVGYWDYIGWKDPFARRDFNERQSQLARTNKNRTVYTPGVFVQGRETPRWSDGRGFETTVKSLNATPARAQIEVSSALDGRVLKVNAKASGVDAGASQLFVALTQGGFSTQVKAGENRGELLRNDHVVREWSGPLPLAGGAATWNIAEGIDIERLRLVAFVQDRASGVPIQAMSAPVKRCEK